MIHMIVIDCVCTYAINESQPYKAHNIFFETRVPRAQSNSGSGEIWRCAFLDTKSGSQRDTFHISGPNKVADFGSHRL